MSRPHEIANCAATLDDPDNHVERPSQHTGPVADRGLVTEQEVNLSTAAVLHQPVNQPSARSRSLLRRVQILLLSRRDRRRRLPPRCEFLEPGRMQREMFRL
jgi:hypothetical protein